MVSIGDEDAYNYYVDYIQYAYIMLIISIFITDKHGCNLI